MDSLLDMLQASIRQVSRKWDCSTVIAIRNQNFINVLLCACKVKMSYFSARILPLDPGTRSSQGQGLQTLQEELLADVEKNSACI